MAKANPRESRLRHEQQRDRKMHYRLLSLVVSVAGLLVSGACLGNDTLESVRRRLIPKPQQLQIGTGEFTWNKEIPLIVEPGNARDQFAAETLISACRQRKLPTPKIHASQQLGKPVGPRILIGDPSRCWPLHEAIKEAGISLSDEIINQGYVLDITPQRILIAATTSAGVYYGVQTLIQLMPQSPTTAIPSLRVTDWSLIELRGISIDMYSGEVYKPAMLEETIRRLGRYKLNAVVLYLEDAFLFSGHPDIGEGRDRLTADETLRLDALARKHHVDLIPCYNSPAHMGNTLAHANYAHLAESGKIGGVINVTHPETYPLLRDLYGDLCKAFPSRYHYVPADEVFGLAMGKSAEVGKRVGRGNLLVRHLKIMHEVLAEHGKRMAISADPYEPGFFDRGFFAIGHFGVETLKKLPRDVIVGPWHYGKVKSYPFGDQLKKLRFDQFLLTSNASMGRLFPLHDSAADNVESFAPHAHRLQALGVFHTDWNVPGKNTFYEYNWPATAHFAEWAWCKSGRPYRELLPLAVESFYGAGTAPLAETIGALSNCSSHFGRVVFGQQPPEYRQFFAEMAPAKMNQQRRDRVAAFASELKEARVGLERARKAATRNREHLDFFEFALDQQEARCELVECRRLLATQGKSDSLHRRLRELQHSLAKLEDRYEQLWHRSNRPLGLKPNRERFQNLRQSIEKRLGDFEDQ